MDIYVARQPIFDLKKRVYAYELLFRDGLSNVMPRVDGDVATSSLLSHSYYSIGLDRITGGKMAFINFTRNLLLDEIPLMFPRETTVVEILEDVEAEAGIIAVCQHLARAGYLIALDDIIFDLKLKPLIQLADIIKVDFRAVSPEEIRDYMQVLQSGKARLLAEKVESIAEFNAALDLGFSLFQGYFFCRPEIIQGREISTSKFNLLQIVAEVNSPEMNLARLEQIISRDVSISYKLLRYINSAYFKRVRDISSIRQALIMLGEREVRRFVSLMALSNLTSEKPDELLRNACVRARFLERIAGLVPGAPKGDELFTLGLFSNIDAILDQQMAGIMEKLPLSPVISEALVDRRGGLLDYLLLVECFEQADWEALDDLLSRLSLPRERIPDIYRDACFYSNVLAAC